jgi:hypothetical protein
MPAAVTPTRAVVDSKYPAMAREREGMAFLPLKRPPSSYLQKSPQHKNFIVKFDHKSSESFTFSETLLQFG